MKLKKIGLMLVVFALSLGAFSAPQASAASSKRLTFDDAATIAEANVGAGGGQQMSSISLDDTTYFGSASIGQSIKVADRLDKVYRLKVLDAFNGLDMTSGTVYTISARVRVNEASAVKAGRFFLSVIDSSVPQQYTKAADSYLVDDQGWAELKMTYIVSDKQVSGIAVEQTYSGAYSQPVSVINVDEVVVSEYEEPDGNGTPSVSAIVYKGTPVIDGQAEELWQSAEAFETNIFSKGTTGAKASVRLLWDDTALYVLAEVSDPVRSAVNPLPYEQDSVEFFLDENNGKSVLLDSDDSQYRISYLNEHSYGGQALETFESQTTENADGYVVEAAIPIQFVQAEAGTAMGFEVQVNDDPGTGSRASIAKWHDPTNNSFKDASGWGTIRLADDSLPGGGLTISAYVDGKQLSFLSGGPTEKEGVVLAPIAELFEALHASATWDAQTEKLTVVRGGDTLTVTAGQSAATLNGQPVAMDTAAELSEQGVLLAPVQLLEVFGATVDWDRTGGIVRIRSNQIFVDKTAQRQEIWGFGGSANNPVNDLKNLPDPADKEYILDQLFGMTGSGAGLSVVRLEINPFQKTDAVPANALQATALPAPGVWDWDTDEHQRWFAEQAVSHGEDIGFYAVPWSAPAWMKDNQSELNGGHLLPEYRETYAEYLKTWVEHYLNQYGLHMKWLSVTNEPNTVVPYASSEYTYEEMDTVAGLVADAIHDADLPVQVGAPEGNSKSTTADYLNHLSSGTLNKLDFIATHSYGGYTNDLSVYGKPLFLTEISSTAANDPSIKDGIDNAKQIVDALTQGYRGWLRWWFVTPPGTNSGEALVQLKADGSYTINKRLYTIGQFSRFIRPGDVRIDAGSGFRSLQVVAASDPETGRASLVVVNDSTAPIAAPVYGLTADAADVYRTSADENLVHLGSQTIANGAFDYTFPPQSVTTFVEADDTEVAAAAASLSGPNEAEAGQSFDLTYSLQSVGGSVYANSVVVRYDPERLAFLGAESLSDHIAVAGSALGEGRMKLAGYGLGSAIASNSDVLTLHFHALPGTSGSANVELSDVRVSDGDGQIATIAGRSHTLAISGPNLESLYAALAEAHSAAEAAVVSSTLWGHYPQSAVNQLKSAIAAAETRIAETISQAEADEKAVMLSDALAMFRSQVNKNRDIGDLAVMGRYYLTAVGDSNWPKVSMYDTSGDGKLDLEDILNFAREMGLE